jgi:hypothetical protein
MIDHVHTSALPPSKVFEGNNACIVLVMTDKQFKPCTEHIPIIYHHHDQVFNGTLKIIKVGNDENIADK